MSQDKLNIKYVDMGLDEVPVIVGAEVMIDDFVAQACGYGLWGIENLSLTPGTVASALKAGERILGVSLTDVISGVVCFDSVECKKTKFKIGEWPREDDRYSVTGVLCRLSRKYKPSLTDEKLVVALEGKTPDSPQEVRDAIIRMRTSIN